MFTTATSHSINYGQLATATDRLLVLGLPQKRNLARGSYSNIERPTAQGGIVAIALHKPTRRVSTLGAIIAIGLLLGFATTRLASAHAEVARVQVR